MRFFKAMLLLFYCVIFQESILAQNADIDLLKQINVNRNKKLDGAMKFISNSEAYLGVGIPIGICAAAITDKNISLLEKGINISCAVAVVSINTYVLKRVVNRDRPSQTYPFIDALQSEKHYSFPSGHTSNAFCTATSLSLNFRKWYIVIPSYAWATSVGYSRMHLGVHYPSDVFAGALLGAGSGWATFQVNKLLKKRYLKKLPENDTH